MAMPVPITGAWGEAPDTADPGNLCPDVGYTIPPLPQAVVEKTAEIIDDNNDGQLQPPEVLTMRLPTKPKPILAGMSSWSK